MITAALVAASGPLTVPQIIWAVIMVPCVILSIILMIKSRRIRGVLKRERLRRERARGDRAAIERTIDVLERERDQMTPRTPAKEPIVKNAIACGLCRGPMDRYDTCFVCRDCNALADLNTGIAVDLSYTPSETSRKDPVMRPITHLKPLQIDDRIEFKRFGMGPWRRGVILHVCKPPLGRQPYGKIPPSFRVRPDDGVGEFSDVHDLNVFAHHMRLLGEASTPLAEHANGESGS